MQRRRDHRTNRRIPCELTHDGHMARGIVVDVSRRGLFVQTDAAIDPGEEVEVHLNGSSHFEAMTLRVIVARRRKTPARLAVMVRRGIGLEILEAPAEWYEAVGEAAVAVQASAEADPSRTGTLGAWEAMESVPADPHAPAAIRVAPDLTPESRESSDEFDALKELLFPSPDELPPAESEESDSPDEHAYNAQDISVLFPAGDGWISPDTGSASQAIVIDNGELDDVHAMLQTLGAAPVRHRCEDPAGFEGWARPPRVFAVSARRALALRVPRRAEQEGVVAIAVAEEYSETLCALMLRRGFRYVVRRPIHPEALRLLLMSALYRDRDHRSEPRLAVGGNVTYRQGLRRRSATLLEISSRGCRLLTEHPVTSATRLVVRIPGAVYGGRDFSLTGRTVHCLRHGAESNHFALGLRFESLTPKAEKQLSAFLSARSAGPAALPGRERRTGTRKPETPEVAAEIAPGVTQERRAQSRGSMRSEVLALDPESKQVRHVLFGVDLSRHGVRVELHPELGLGDKLQVVLYDDHRKDPLLVEAEVSRDDGPLGLALLFRAPGPEQVVRLEALIERLPAVEMPPLQRPGRGRGIAIGAIGQRSGDDD